MNFEDIQELHYITHIGNVQSICENGILSHKYAGKVSHISVASPDVQERRARKIIPGGKSLHDYVNLYFDARNPMLYFLKDQHAELCILCINPAVMELTGVIISDRNSSSEYARFSKYPEGLARLNAEVIFARYWTHPDNPFLEMEHKSIKCAEVLVPDNIDPQFITGCYVSCDAALERFKMKNVSVSAILKSFMFFR